MQNRRREQERTMTDASDPYAAVMAQVVGDPVFRMRLMADPVATLKAAGVAIPDGVAVRVVENTDTLVRLVLPAIGVVELADSDLEAVAGWVCTKQPTFGCGKNIG
jgi:hypothetical protein